MRKLKPKRQLMDDEIDGKEINEKNETLDGGKMQQRDEVGFMGCYGLNLMTRREAWAEELECWFKKCDHYRR